MKVNRSRSRSDTRESPLLKSTHAVWDQWTGWRQIPVEETDWWPYSGEGWVGKRSTILDHVADSPWGFGKVTLNDVLLTKTERTVVPCELTTHCTSGVHNRFHGDLGTAMSNIWEPPLTPQITDEVRDYHLNLALIKAYAKMNQPDMVSGEYLAEMSKTLGMLRRPLGNSLRLLSKIEGKAKRKLRKGSTRSNANIARAYSDAWLEYRLGWFPIFKDMDHAIDSVSAGFSQFSSRLRVARGSSKANDISSSGSYSGTLPTDATFRLDFTRQMKERLRADAGVIYSIVETDDFSKVMGYLGLRPRDIPATLWELTPLSFVYDWFSHFGTWIQAITPNPSVQIKGHWTTSVRETFLETGNGSITRDFYLDSPTVSTGTTGLVTEKTVEYRRVCDQPITFNPLMPVNKLGVIQSISGLSLLTSKVLAALQRIRH